MPTTIAPAPRCVGTKRGYNHGIVYAPDGAVIGRVFAHKRDAAGTYPNPEKRPFWTAHAIVAGIECTTSLGTRHPSRASAVAAVRAFAVSYPDPPMHWSGGWGNRRATGERVSRFKLLHPKVCALPVRKRAV